ncbi:DNA cytosine methyltransferase [Salmonella bongori]|uniref:DNA cytosine methyltransferase n=1 Tax=Salmonella bongori TaxID=54736 RepID=UPI0012827DA4|nr:DNA cytosine methyltransferase [Salmonella bongori]ECG8260398.1 DNA cytosine methyltransferase [Salmonella bongori serovar 48:i:-]ECG9254730.1 DNA cytosine methyltransferase [Salmonella bongori]EDP8708197.1 DNA cytosine methyltransferase [Salmonella bongori]EDP8725817.1 DNA cytosine methyltransferase [Salmonella bongori]EEO9371573.1 DNA cytosine methyltransferase [Salmonella bongori]
MNIQAVDIFCGAGGLTFGLRTAGIEVTHGIDIDESCRYPIENNNKNTKFVHRSVTDISSDEVSAMFNGDSIRLLAGCAPCQPFSKYRNPNSRKDDSKWRLLRDFERLVMDIHPELVTMENVPQLRTHSVFKKFVRSLKSKGYHIWFDVVNCSDYGLPQNRRRLILIGSLLGKIEFDQQKVERKVTVKDAIGNLPKVDAGTKSEKDVLHRSPQLRELNLKRIMHSVPGGTWDDWPEDIRADCHKKDSGMTYKSVYGRMEWDDTSPTITTQCYGYGNGRFGHPEQHRAITLREAAILQSFPSKYKFLDGKTAFSFQKLGTMIGNAVPPIIGQAIGETFIRHVEQINTHY